ncbi:hypothetical protein OJ252_2594 [Cryptosporidium canis]|uniref:Uncharacterized protein n=1 Tax=Cryptosporidium canis TaxID=195482 RepID=A0ABQ8P7Q5_9CRYT|nr:hypothetical protein OJ252_2594 [Cryptosporidium canis]
MANLGSPMGLFGLSGLFRRKTSLLSSLKPHMCISKCLRGGRLGLGRTSKVINGDKIANHAMMQERLWRTLVPEKYLSFNSSSFFLLAALTIGLHQYNLHKEKLKPDSQ